MGTLPCRVLLRLLHGLPDLVLDLLDAVPHLPARFAYLADGGELAAGDVFLRVGLGHVPREQAVGVGDHDVEDVRAFLLLHVDHGCELGGSGYLFGDIDVLPFLLQSRVLLVLQQQGVLHCLGHGIGLDDLRLGLDVAVGVEEGGGEEAPQHRLRGRAHLAQDLHLGLVYGCLQEGEDKGYG